jgi:tetrahydromethanopterin S-methyltransferase subunit A
LNSLAELAGQLCKILLPINEEMFYGNQSSNVAMCTLSSMNLLKEISNSDLMGKIILVGRLLSENKGIDELIRYVNKHPTVDTIIVCGMEVSGHKAGHALFCVHKYGTDEQNRIINSISPDPVLSVSKSEIQQFQKQITLINKIGQTDLDQIRSIVDSQ